MTVRNTLNLGPLLHDSRLHSTNDTLTPLTRQRSMMLFLNSKLIHFVKAPVAALCFAALASTPLTSKAQSTEALSLASMALPDAPVPQHAAQASTPGVTSQREEPPTLLGMPKRIVVDELHIVTSPAHLRSHDLLWLLPVAGATAASLATDSMTMRDVVSHNAAFNASASTSSDVLRGLFIGGPVALFGTGQFIGNAKAREAGLLAGEAMVDGYITSEGIKYITLRERPNLQNARGHFFQGDAAADPSFVSGHAIVAWSSAAALAGEYSRPWQQIGLYTLASGVSLTRVLSQEHFPTDALLGSVSGWLIGRYVYRAHHTHSTR